MMNGSYRILRRRFAARAASCILVSGLGLLPLVWGCAAPGRTVAEPTLTAEQREANVASFDYVWTTIRDSYFDPDFGGLDWEAIRDELRPRVVEAATMAEARAAMADLIRRLGQSHFAILPSEVYLALDVDTPSDAQVESQAGVIGVEVRVIDDQALVTQVRPDSPAEEAGVRPGWQITRIGEQELAPVIARIDEAYRESTLRDVLLSRAVFSRLSGPVGEPVTIEFCDDADQTVELEIERSVPPGVKAQLGHVPVFYVWMEARPLGQDQEVGYIAFNAFFDPPSLMPQFEQAVESFRGADGIIIDLRGNPGGIGAMAMGMAGWFVGESGRKLGTMHLRTGEIHFAVFPRARPYDGPLAILIDGCSGSTAEFFPAGLRDLGRARLFGTRTMGAALPSAIERLPNNDGFQYAIADYLSASGERLEGIGVPPDVEVHLTREALLAGRDPVIEAAHDWILAERAAQAEDEPPAPSLPAADVAADPRVGPTPEVACAEEVLTWMVEALGGEAALSRLHNRVTRGTFAAGPQQEVTGHFTIYQAAPNKSYRLVEMDHGDRSEAGTDGEIYWDVTSILGARILSGEEQAAMQRETTLNNLLHWRQLYSQAECVDVQTEGERPFYKLLMTPQVGSPETWYVDYHTHLLLRKDFTLSNPLGTAPVELTLGDYREVDGVRIAHRITQTTFGVVRVVRVESIEHNVEIPESRFMPPPEIQARLESGSAAPVTPQRPTFRQPSEP